MSDDLQRPILDYAPDPTWKLLHSFFNELEAQLVANELDASSIPAKLFNVNTKSTVAYSPLVKIDLLVPADQFETAKAILAEQLRPEVFDLLEPAEPDDASQPKIDHDAHGQPLELVAVATFETARELKQAALILEAARIEPYVPKLISRATAAAGEGRRFVLRVAAADLPRANQALAHDANPADDVESGNELQCPRCGAWNIHEIKHELSNMLLSLVGKSKPEQCECLKCHYIADRSEFIHRVGKPK